jgi:hypothetical protein
VPVDLANNPGNEINKKGPSFNLGPFNIQHLKVAILSD